MARSPAIYWNHFILKTNLPSHLPEVIPKRLLITGALHFTWLEVYCHLSRWSSTIVVYSFLIYIQPKNEQIDLLHSFQAYVRRGQIWQDLTSNPIPSVFLRETSQKKLISSTHHHWCGYGGHFHSLKTMRENDSPFGLTALHHFMLLICRKGCKVPPRYANQKHALLTQPSIQQNCLQISSSAPAKSSGKRHHARLDLPHASEKGLLCKWQTRSVCLFSPSPLPGPQCFTWICSPVH